VDDRTFLASSLPEQFPSHILMADGLSRVHALTDLLALGAELQTPLDQEIEDLVIEREQGIPPVALGLQDDSLAARGLEDLADRNARGAELVSGRIGAGRIGVRPNWCQFRMALGFS
jgi:hypothetical protein